MPKVSPSDHVAMDNDLAARPIILIGAGRSGSTLFARLLDSHPRIQFLGETDFLLPRLWRETWENRFWLNFNVHTDRQPSSSRDSLPAIDQETLDAERERLAALVRRLFGDILKVRADADAWGYKEIWNGNDAVACFPWDSYDEIFPEATWVHLVRHPFDFLLSVARWNLSPLTDSFVAHELSHWAQMVEWNRRRATRKKFIEIRYEDLKHHPKTTLLPIFSMAGIEWSDDCLTALSSSVMQSRKATPFSPAPALTRNRLSTMIAQIDHLARYMDELAYDPPETFPQEIMDTEIIEKLPDYVDLRDPARTP